MSVSVCLFFILLVATSVLSAVSDKYAAPAALILIALLVSISATSATSVEIRALKDTFHRFLIFLLLPFAWMAMQIMPIPSALANPIWSSAAAALNSNSLYGYLSINPIATFGSIIHYCALLALFAAIYVLCRERHRAERVLFAITMISTTIVITCIIAVLIESILAFDFLKFTQAHDLGTLSLLSGLSSAAMVMLTIERRLFRGLAEPLDQGNHNSKTVAGVFGIMISLIAPMIFGRGELLRISVIGFSLIILVFAVRRLHLRERLSVALILIVMATLVVAVLPSSSALVGGDLIPRSPTEQAASFKAARLALADSPWLGSGVGNFVEVAKVYENLGEDAAPPSTVVLVIVEWGMLALPLFAISALSLFVFLIGSTVTRGRDSTYPSLGASCLLAFFCSSFDDSGMRSDIIQIFLASTMGLAIAQSTRSSSSQ